MAFSSYSGDALSWGAAGVSIWSVRCPVCDTSLQYSYKEAGGSYIACGCGGVVITEYELLTTWPTMSFRELLVKKYITVLGATLNQKFVGETLCEELKLKVQAVVQPAMYALEQAVKPYEFSYCIGINSFKTVAGSGTIHIQISAFDPSKPYVSTYGSSGYFSGSVSGVAKPTIVPKDSVNLEALPPSLQEFMKDYTK